MKKFIKKYWDIFRANVNDGKRSRENLSGIRITLFLLSIFAFIMSLRYVVIRDFPMLLSAIVLCVLFLATFFVLQKSQNRSFPLLICILGITTVFTYYILSGGNSSFSILWTLLAPMFIMAAIGVKSGTIVGLYFQILLTIFFWTPLKSTVSAHYSETFLSQFPILYLCTLIITLAIMLSHKRQQLILDRYQEDLENAVREERAKVSQITFQTIASITSIVDAKDTYTDDHSIRVANYSCLIADELGWAQSKIDTLYHAALLHDIGKVGIQDSILKKSAGLSPKEYEIMKSHTSIGASILKELSFLDRADEGALYHHEKFDGTGYPFGLKGENIPINARIIGVADAFDAMNTNRTYREKCTDAYIIDEMRKGSGTQFDPDIVAALLRCIEKKKIQFPIFD